MTVDHTALLVAGLRAKTSIPYAREIAELFPCQEVFDQLIPRSGMTATWRRGMTVESRYRHTNKILRDYGVTMVAEIGTGLCPRCLEFTDDPFHAFLATGLDDSLKWTNTMVQQLVSNRPNLMLAEVDILHSGQLRQAVAAWRPDVPMAVVSEGVLPYFTREQKRQALTEIRAVLLEQGGMLVTCDTNTRIQLEGSGAMRRVVDHVSAQVGTDLYDNAFVDNGEVCSFFSSCGFRVELVSMREVLDEMSCINLLGVTREQTAEFLADRYSAVLIPS